MFQFLSKLQSQPAQMALVQQIDKLLISTGDWTLTEKGELKRDEDGAPVPLPEKICEGPTE